MKWEIKNNGPKRGDVRFITRFAFFPTRVLNKLTMSDHIIWLELYLEEQEYGVRIGYDGKSVQDWYTVSKTIHI
jgi:hypothetical protein